MGGICETEFLRSFVHKGEQMLSDHLSLENASVCQYLFIYLYLEREFMNRTEREGERI